MGTDLVPHDHRDRSTALDSGRRFHDLVRAGAALNRTSRLVVRAQFGHARIGGVYPSPEARADALRIGAAIPGVAAATGAPASDPVTS